MSITFSLLLLLLLLLSLHACDARSLRNHTSKEVDQRSNTFKENEKLDPARVSNSLPNNAGGIRDLDNEERAVNVDEAKERVVALKGGGQPEAAGFNQLDYLPPKTHPPVHN